MNRILKKGKSLLKVLQWLAAAGGGLIFCLPVLILVCGSLADAREWTLRMKAALNQTDGYILWRWLPEYPTAEHYKRLLFYTPEFLALFWNSIRITACILLGQLLAAVPGAWSFAVYRFKGRDLLFSVYVILMLLPFQVMQLSKYLVLDRAGMLDSQWALILPAVFSTYPVFLIYRSFSGIPKELLEAARIDGAGELFTFLKVGLPLSQGGILSAMILSFLECWNMMEEPLAFLKDKSLWPLSLYLPQISMAQAGFACAASVITLAVSLLVFAIFRDSLEQGIISSGLKG